MRQSARRQDAPWVLKAVRELGQKEIPGKEKNNPKIQEYLACAEIVERYDETPWCAAFIRWLFGEKGSGLARDLLHFGTPVNPRVGAVTILSRDDGGPLAGHAGLLLEMPFTKNGVLVVRLLGGNQKDSVSISDFPADRVLGYRWPQSVVVEKLTKEIYGKQS